MRVLEFVSIYYPGHWNLFRQGCIKAILSKRMNVNMKTVCKFPIEKSAATFEATVGRSASYEKAK